MSSIEIRNIAATDYPKVIGKVNEWWGGRSMADMLPKLFVSHFEKTSFIAEEDGECIGFLVGFLSQSKHDEAYIHFVGVHPEHRKSGLAKTLYQKFFAVAAENDRQTIKAVTSPVNKTSIAFHKKMGFAVQPGNADDGNVSIHTNYDGPGQDRVCFVRIVEEAAT